MTFTVDLMAPFDLLSPLEAHHLQQATQGEISSLLRSCALAVLNAGADIATTNTLLDRYPHFDIHLACCQQGVKLQLLNPPQQAFINGELIHTVRKNLTAVLRDLLSEQIHTPTEHGGWSNNADATDITYCIFAILRRAQVVQATTNRYRIVCWGGHAIDHLEFQYAYQVGYGLGLHGFNICTGCGPGAMEAPMRGAAVGHAQQGYLLGEFIGLTEPTIIAIEPPNRSVNQLVILPDIEKRLEAFLRIAHGIVVFPGGVGTMEELLYVLATMMHNQDQEQWLPLIFTGPQESASYWQTITGFLTHTLGGEVKNYYRLIINDPLAVSHQIKQFLEQKCSKSQTMRYFHWDFTIPPELQQPFSPTHDNMTQLYLYPHHSAAKLAIILRHLFSGIVSGNIRSASRTAVIQNGPFRLQGEQTLLLAIDQLLNCFVEQRRMQLPRGEYMPCYEIATEGHAAHQSQSCIQPN